MSQWDVISKKDFTLDSFHGIISFEHHHSKVSKFKNLMQTMKTSKYPIDISQIRTKWNYFNCSETKNNYSAMNHSFNTTLEWSSQHTFDMGLSEGYNLHNAVYIMVDTYHDISFHQVDSHLLAKLEGIFIDCHQIK